MNERIIIKNAVCMTMDEQREADWLVIEGDRIAAVGRGNGWEAYTGEQAAVIDAGGNTVLPGFIDNHFHVVEAGLTTVFIDLSDARNFREIGERIKAAADKRERELIVANCLDRDALEEKVFPDRTVIDKYCNDIPVVIYAKDFHTLILNTFGILYFKAPLTLEGVEVDEQDMPTGIFSNHAGARLDYKISSSFSEEEIRAGINKMMKKLLSCGLTTVTAMEGGHMAFSSLTSECEYMYQHQDSFPVDTVLFYQTTDVDLVLEKGLPRIGGTLYVDGTLGRRTAALSSEYCDAPGQCGILCMDSTLLTEFVVSSCEHGLQSALDAIGDAAVEAILCAFEEAAKTCDVSALRCRIEHGELLRRDQMERARRLGLIISMQPAYEGEWGGAGGMYEKRLGSRYTETNQLREIIDSGVVICGGSDFPTTDVNPMVGIHYAVNHPVAAHRISVEEAVAMYTCNGAYALFCEHEAGSLTAGKRADIVILDQNIQLISADRLKDTMAAVTIKNGRIVFNRWNSC